MIELENYCCCHLNDIYLSILVDISAHILHLFDALDIHENLFTKIDSLFKAKKTQNIKLKKKLKIFLPSIFIHTFLLITSKDIYYSIINGVLQRNITLKQ